MSNATPAEKAPAKAPKAAQTNAVIEMCPCYVDKNGVCVFLFVPLRRTAHKTDHFIKDWVTSRMHSFQFLEVHYSRWLCSVSHRLPWTLLDLVCLFRAKIIHKMHPAAYDSYCWPDFCFFFSPQRRTSGIRQCVTFCPCLHASAVRVNTCQCVLFVIFPQIRWSCVYFFAVFFSSTHFTEFLGASNIYHMYAHESISFLFCLSSFSVKIDSMYPCSLYLPLACASLEIWLVCLLIGALSELQSRLLADLGMHYTWKRNRKKLEKIENENGAQLFSFLCMFLTERITSQRDEFHILCNWHTCASFMKRNIYNFRNWFRLSAKSKCSTKFPLTFILEFRHGGKFSLKFSIETRKSFLQSSSNKMWMWTNEYSWG